MHDTHTPQRRADRGVSPFRTSRVIGLFGIVTAGIAAVAFVAPLAAQPPAGLRHQESGDIAQHVAKTLLLRRADADQDGAVTADEWSTLVAEIDGQFATLDEDGDGSIDVPSGPRLGRHDRFRSRNRGPGIARHRIRTAAGLGLMSAADRTGNDDGILGRDEWQQFLTDADTDFDGSLNPAESIEALRASHPEDSERPTPEPPTVAQLLERFDELDQNDDGQLDRDEWRRPHPRRLGDHSRGAGRSPFGE